MFEMTSGDSGPLVTVCVLASGSKGNALYISDHDTAILIDAGLSGKELEKRMLMRGLSLDSVNALLITHEHTDHIKGAGVLSRRYKLPVYINEKTFEAGETIMGKLHTTEWIECGRDFSVGDMKIHPFSISHDAADPVGFTIECKGVKIGVATDLGMANLVVREHLKNANLLIIESNHDPVMLIENDNYPWQLKQRVKGRKGHLANHDTCALLSELIHDRLHHVVLAHVSEENNTHEKILESASLALNGSGITHSIALQHEPGEIIRIHSTCVRY